MEELFNILSSSARLDKSKRPKKRARTEETKPAFDEETSTTTDELNVVVRSRDKTGKRDLGEEKRQQIHREEIAAFRRSVNIKLANKHDPDVPDPITNFEELNVPSWWSSNSCSGDANLATGGLFRNVYRAIKHNIEAGRWKEPTPIQMQAIPTLLEKRDFIGAAPTGSGKSGAFIIPALLFSSAPYDVFFGTTTEKKNKKGKKKQETMQGEIRALLLAPSLELASQLHREVERLGRGKPGGLSSVLLSKSNAPQVIARNVGGKHGLDVLVATPLRLVDCIDKGLRLDRVRMVVLDEADRLLDATDGKKSGKVRKDSEEETPGDGAEGAEDENNILSGSSQSKTFLAQMDCILSEVPVTATRALFSATITPTVRSLSESILRSPVDVTISSTGTQGGANPDIQQELTFVGREEGKLLAIRQIVQRGELRPPVIIFLQSQQRAQALFEELLYDGIHVDVIHAGRSKAARENAVAKFRKGETWVLICTDLVARGVDFRAVNMVINYDLPASGVTYIHRIGRTGRGGRKGRAITFFTEDDFDSLRTIANIMKQSGCNVDEWMLHMKRKQSKKTRIGRHGIDTTPSYDRRKTHHKQQIVEASKKRKREKLNNDQK